MAGANNDITDYVLNGITDVYGIVVTAVDESNQEYDYPLRHIENMWKISELSWCTGFTTEVHGCRMTSDLYMSLPGQSISYVTYYTNTGIYYVKATVAADTNYKAATSKAAKLVIKPAQKLTYKKTTATYKVSALKSGKKTFKIGAASKQIIQYRGDCGFYKP